MRALLLISAAIAVLVGQQTLAAPQKPVTKKMAVKKMAAKKAFAQKSSVMRAFNSDADLISFLKRRHGIQDGEGAVPPGMPIPAGAAVPPPPVPAPVPLFVPPPSLILPNASPAPAPAAAAEAVDDVVVTGAQAVKAKSENITNRQEAEVDEGGIIKNYGNYLVILRRGRLFTVSVADKSMKPVAQIDAFPPGVSGQGDWYDEMLISGNRVIVVGYSYARGGTEINRFTVGADGSLKYEDTHHLKSNDYYSSRNYASRLIGSKLIFYTPLYFDDYDWIAGRGKDQLPGVRRWSNTKAVPFKRLAQAQRIYVAEPVRNRSDSVIDTLHSVSICDLAKADLACTATGILGAESRTFYVSGSAVYVWVSDQFDERKGKAQSMLYRMPLNGAAPSAVRVSGGPVDQFSFKEDKSAGRLNVVVRSEGGNDAMWKPEVSDGDVALLRLPLSRFGSGVSTAERMLYRPLPKPSGDDWSFQNRFAANHLLYTAGTLQSRTKSTSVYVVPLSGGQVDEIQAPHSVDRIELMGSDAVVVGGGHDRSLGFTSIELGARPNTGDTFRLPAASEGESRSHAYFYRPDSVDGADGLLGLPVSKQLEASMSRFLGNGSAILFLNRKAKRFSEAGQLEAQAVNARDDGCMASCVDWYGNARPIFLRGRVFALMGYELVEGTHDGSRIREAARVDFAPGSNPRR